MNWISNHLDLIDEKRLDEARVLHLTHLPSSLYKYKSLNRYTLECLNHSTVWMSDLQSLNDPYECYPTLDYEQMSCNFFRKNSFREDFKAKLKVEISEEEHNSIITSDDMWDAYHSLCKSKQIKIKDKDIVFNELKQVWDSAILYARNNLRICSLTERLDSTIMWSHYAEHHKGICIEYNFHNSNDAVQYIYPVSYTDDLFDFTFNFDFSSHKRRHRFTFAALQKATDWQYEKEWRVAFPNVNNSSNHYKTPIPTAIYLGSRYDENPSEMKLALDKIIKKLNIPVYKMRLDFKKYKMIPE